MIIVVCGPTGVGKTKLSETLAKKYNGIVVNADAMQVYKHLNIGTAKIKECEMENVPHYLFDICNVEDDYSIYNYQQDFRNLLKENPNKNIILVGGSGLYIKSALFDYRFSKEDNNLNENYNEYSNEDLKKMADKKDKNNKIHVNNRKRLIRFLNKKDNNIVEPVLLYKNVFFIGLTTSRDKLYERINKRVDIMLENGLLEEVTNLKDRYKNSRILNSGIGYKEFYDYFFNNKELNDVVEQIKLDSRRYAKRQYTFFKHQFDTNWFDVNFNDFSKTIEEVYNFIQNKNNSN